MKLAQIKQLQHSPNFMSEEFGFGKNINFQTEKNLYG